MSLGIAATALAADVTGTWTGTMSMGDQQFSLTYNLKQTGDKLTGTLLTPQGDSLEILDGKVSGDKVSFAVKTDIGNGMVKFISEGAVKSTGEIVLTTHTEDGNEFGGGPMTLKKAK